MISLFGKTKELVVKIDSFIDLTSQSVLHFRQALHFFLDDRFEDFEERLNVIREVENKADDLRKDVEAQLYRQTLIPESRGDVLGILESMDSIIDRVKYTVFEFSIEKPDIPDKQKKRFLELIEPVVKSVESLVFASRAFFYDINAVKDHLHLVKFYEKEADIISEKMKREVFNSDLDLTRKIQLRYFTHHIDTVADKAEEVSDRLSIATIKRII